MAARHHVSMAPALVASDIVAIVLVIVATAFVVVVVIGLHVWGAIQDGRAENAFRASRRRRDS